MDIDRFLSELEVPALDSPESIDSYLVGHGMSVEELPIALRYYQVMCFSPDGLERLLSYRG